MFHSPRNCTIVRRSVIGQATVSFVNNRNTQLFSGIIQERLRLKFSYYSGREAPSLKMGSVCLLFVVVVVVGFFFVVVGVDRSRLRSTALITSLFCTRKMTDPCLVCLY